MVSATRRRQKALLGRNLVQHSFLSGILPDTGPHLGYGGLAYDPRADVQYGLLLYLLNRKVLRNPK